MRTVVPVSTVAALRRRRLLRRADADRAGRLDLWLTRFAAATSLAASAGEHLALRRAAELREARWRWPCRCGGDPGSGYCNSRLFDIDALRTIAPEVADKNLRGRWTGDRGRGSSPESGAGAPGSRWRRTC